MNFSPTYRGRPRIASRCFSTSTIEVWIEQISTSTVKYYRLEGATPGSSDLTGLFDRNGFTP